MTSERRFEHDLPELLAQVGLGPRPNYRDDIVRRTGRMRQRPAWTLPERWLPMSVTSTRLTSPPGIPWRLIALAALIVALIGGALLIAAGSRSRLPAPFGLAANGLVAYDHEGDIYTADPVSGQTVAVVTGSDWDTRPVWSRDGTKFAFIRSAGPGLQSGRLAIGSVGSRQVTIATPDSYTGIADVSFSPDGREIAFTDASGVLYVAKVDGSQVRVIEHQVVYPSWRPPDGAEIIMAGGAGNDGGAASGMLYAIDTRTSDLRPILQPESGTGRDAVSVSPDGSLIAYSASSSVDTGRNTYQIHVVGIDGSGDRVLPMPAGATFQDMPTWSNDGKRLAIIRGYSTRNQDVVVAIVPADGSGTGIETAHHLTGCCDNRMEWAPADSAVLLLPEDSQGNPIGQVSIDPATGAATTVSWAATSIPTWQRRAP